MTPTEKLRKIAAIYEVRRKTGKNTYTSSHARYNLEGALLDLERTGKADEICLKTIRRVLTQLAKIEELLPMK